MAWLLASIDDSFNARVLYLEFAHENYQEPTSNSTTPQTTATNPPPPPSTHHQPQAYLATSSILVDFSWLPDTSLTKEVLLHGKPRNGVYEFDAVTVLQSDSRLPNTFHVTDCSNNQDFATAPFLYSAQTNSYTLWHHRPGHCA
ncbi:hypothetical protein PIB30_067695 [Stylosanthes scabra]|uniref:Uncharacterized protein n=1 Tax=Stylosanthes scabra TaxID=79078 RepID=A0ABU6XL70_9FABA|nr:hypothetical protein [Stylosanthes scabra]